MTRTLLVIVLLIILGGAAYYLTRSPAVTGPTMNALAERYVRLVLALGQHDADYVDAYYGPAEWRTEAEKTKVPLSDIDAASADLARVLPTLAPSRPAQGAADGTSEGRLAVAAASVPDAPARRTPGASFWTARALTCAALKSAKPGLQRF